MLQAIILSAGLALLFSQGMMFKRKDWQYGDGELHSASETRELGWTIFIVTFFLLMLLWGLSSGDSPP